MISIYGHKWTSHLGATADDGNGFLSDTAKTWQSYLAGITTDNLKSGFDNMILRNYEWPPSLPEFRGMCLIRSTDKVPSLDEVISILVMVSSKTGSIAERYKHPLAFAVSLSTDMHRLRLSKHVDAKRMIKPVYDDFIGSGWPDFPAHAYECQLAVTHEKKPVDKELARSFLTAIKEIL